MLADEFLGGVFSSQIVQKEGEKKVMPSRRSSSSQVLVEYVSNDAKFVNERARSDFVLLSRYFFFIIQKELNNLFIT